MKWLKEWQWFSKADTLQLFLYLLLHASEEDKYHCGIRLRRGQIITSISHLCEALESTPRKVRTSIERLTLSHDIDKQTTNKNTILTICNYDSYISVFSGVRQANDKQTTNERQANKENISPTPPLKENINNIYSSSSSISACEEKNFIEILKSDRQWGEVIAMRFSLGTLDTLDSWIDKFALDLQCRDVKHKNLQDAKRHFNDWLRIQIKSQNDTENKRPYPGRYPDKETTILQRQEQHLRDIEQLDAEYFAKTGQLPK